MAIYVLITLILSYHNVLIKAKSREREGSKWGIKMFILNNTFFLFQVFARVEEGQKMIWYSTIFF